MPPPINSVSRRGHFCHFTHRRIKASRSYGEDLAATLLFLPPRLSPPASALSSLQSLAPHAAGHTALDRAPPPPPAGGGRAGQVAELSAARLWFLWTWQQQEEEVRPSAAPSTSCLIKRCSRFRSQIHSARPLALARDPQSWLGFRAGHRLHRRRDSGGLRRLLSVSSLAPTRDSASRWPWGAALQGRIRLGILYFRVSQAHKLKVHQVQGNKSESIILCISL